MIDALKKRRTQYAIGRNLPLTEEAVEDFIRQAISYAPSAFNSQGARAVILFGTESEQFWEIVRETLRAIVPPEDFAATNIRVDAFAAGAGTVLFFEDQDTMRDLQEKFPLYADVFPVYSEQASGMAQYAVWLALANIGVGASLQHYNPLVDTEVCKRWNLPVSWKLRAQMPFGSNEKPVGDKSFLPAETRFRTFR